MPEVATATVAGHYMNRMDLAVVEYMDSLVLSMFQLHSWYREAGVEARCPAMTPLLEHWRQRHLRRKRQV